MQQFMIVIDIITRIGSMIVAIQKAYDIIQTIRRHQKKTNRCRKKRGNIRSQSSMKMKLYHTLISLVIKQRKDP